MSWFDFLYTARRENLYTFIIVFISEFVQIFSPRPVDLGNLYGDFYKILLLMQHKIW